MKFIRDKEGREVAFAIVKDGILEELVEAKWSDSKISTSLSYYSEKLKPSRVTQILAQLKNPYSHGRLHVSRALDFLSTLG